MTQLNNTQQLFLLNVIAAGFTSSIIYNTFETVYSPYIYMLFAALLFFILYAIKTLISIFKDPFEFSSHWGQLVIKTFISLLLISVYILYQYYIGFASFITVITVVLTRIPLTWFIILFHLLAYEVLVVYPLKYFVVKDTSIYYIRHCGLVRLSYAFLWSSVMVISYYHDIYLFNSINLYLANVIVLPIIGTMSYAYSCYSLLYVPISINFEWIGNLFYSYCEDYIPWNITPGVIKAQETLQSIANHIITTIGPNESQFLAEHLSPLLNPLPEYSHIPKTFLSEATYKERNRSFNFTPNCTISSVLTPYSGQAMIYSFTDSSFSRSNTYIGLTQDPLSRIFKHSYDSTHYRSSKTGLLYPYMQKVGGFSNIIFNILESYPSYLTIWHQSHPTITPEFQVILKAFTEFKMGIVEQTLMTNGGSPVGFNSIPTNFNFVNWVPNGTISTDSFFHLTSTHQLMNNLDKTNFDFTLYRSLADHVGFTPLEEPMLEWSLGFMERRLKFFHRYKNIGFCITHKSTDTLGLLRETFGFRGNIIKMHDSYSLILMNSEDRHIIASILYSNIISTQFNETFLKGLTDLTYVDFNAPLLNIQSINLDNAWVSGAIDAGHSFGFERVHSPYIQFATKLYPIIESILILLFGSIFTRKSNGAALHFAGMRKVRPIVNYLNSNPLFINRPSQDWFTQCFNLCDTGQHLSNREHFKAEVAKNPKSYRKT